MPFKSTLLSGAAVCVLVTLTGAPNAQAATRPHRGKHQASRAPVAPPALLAEVRELRDEVRSLQARLDAQAASEQQTQAQVATAAAGAQASQQQIPPAAQAQIDELRAQLDETEQAQAVQTAAINANKPAPLTGWFANTTVGGRVFSDFSDIDQKSNGVRVSPSGTALDIKRFYISVDHWFSDVYSADLTTDAQYSTAIGSTELFIKKAYLQAKYLPWLTLRLGAADLPWVPFVEDIYGYRYVENTLIDRSKFGTSTDWGVHALGSSPPLGERNGPVLSYAVSVIDGTGYKAPPGTGGAPRPDTLDVEGRVSAKWNDVTVAVGGYSGRLGKNAGATFNTPQGILTWRDASRFDALVAYTGGPIRAGLEYFSATNWTAVANRATGDKADGYSVFASYQFAPTWSVFGRYDWVKPNKITASDRKDDYFNLGIDYQPVTIVDLSLVYKREKVENGLLATSNGVIGGARDGTYDELGLFGQFRW